MACFAGRLTITQIDLGGRTWRLESLIRYGDIEAQAGFITDGATVPVRLRFLLPAWGSYSRAAVLHDVLCTALASGKPHPAAKTWKQAALLFLQMMKAEGTGRALRLAMFSVVYVWAIYRDRSSFR
jgi:hypothetical protein